MIEILYWISAFYKTISLLSLLIFIPEKDNPNCRMLISKGFLWLFMNEIILFFVSFLINYSITELKYTYFTLSQLILNVYFIGIFMIIFAYFMKNKMQILSETQIISIIPIIFSWLAFILVGIFTVDTKEINSLSDLENISYGLAWLICLIKFCVQYKVNKNVPSVGLNYIFLICNFSWVLTELGYRLIQRDYSLNYQIMLSLLGFSIVTANIYLINQRKNNKQRIDSDINQENARSGLIYKDQNIKQNKCGNSTYYTSSIDNSIQNY